MTPAGMIIFDFDSPIIALGFDLIDMDHPDTTPTYIRLFGGSDLVAEFNINDFTNPASTLYDPSVEFGLRFETQEESDGENVVQSVTPIADRKNEDGEKPEGDADIVSLDNFRK